MEKDLKPRKKPRQERARVTVEAIVEAAAQVFAEKGYAGGTTNRIAERAGVSIGSLYQYFPNKASVLLRLLEKHMDEGQTLVASLMATAHAQSEEKGLFRSMLRHFVEAMVDFHMQNPKLHRVLFEEAPRPASAMKMLREMEEDVATGVEALLREQEGLRTQNPALAARLVVVVVESLTHWFVLEAPDTTEREVFVDEVSTMLEHYLFCK